MSNDEKIEFSTRGKRQLKAILHSEIKEQIDELVVPMIEKILSNRIAVKLSDNLSRGQIERLVQAQIKDVWWQIVDDMLQKAKFQDKLQEEIIAYLHKRWACGSVPFDLRFDEALMKAVKKLIR